jgi:hypothetical protein
LEGSVSDIQLDGRPCKVLKIALKGVPDSLIFRYWIDLARGGHVVRMECYLPGKVLQSTMSITLSSYKLNGADIWMPTYGEYAGYSGVEDGKPVITKEPAGLQTIYVVDGTMAFNTHPGPETFTIKYKPGTRISDHLRQLNTEFGAQKIDAKPTKVEAEKMLKEQIAKAEQQKSELVVASDPEGFDWWPWTAWGMSAVVLVSLVALILQRRGR